ncbi:protein trichome birefringence-like 34 [Oryza brachyantha]|uniref:protein trichome birefringence-like 34 n=1 Tax=Oryza brachyantha TaxID=4533 RepID=UPI001ADA0E42|nr:protein trichome birefringence-like 34 [Oryza brachyantha]
MCHDRGRDLRAESGASPSSIEMTGSTPPRKSRSAVLVVAAGGEGGVEDAWRSAGEAAKKTTAAACGAMHARVWGVSPRSHFSSFVLLLLLLFVVLAVSVNTKNAAAGEARHRAPPLPPPATDDPPSGETGGGGDEECDLFSGRWVYDEAAYPLYRESACRFMSEQWACEKYGRADLRYQHWRWQPHGCDLPRFDAVKLLEKLRDKRLVFVGDSLNRNQWASMVCLIDTGAPELHTTLNSSRSLVTFKIHEYNASVDFYWSPLLVESNSDHPLRHRIADRIVRAASINKHAMHWTDADVLVFNSYLWWQRPAMKVLWGSFDNPPPAAAAAEGDRYAVYKVIDSLRAYELAVRTWADWMEFHVDRARTQLFFMTMSPTHLRSDEWEAGSDHQCYGETEPIAAAAEGHHRGGGSGTDMAFARAVEAQVRRLAERGVAVRLLNVTQLSDPRKDAHPSVHRRYWDPITDEQRRNPSSYADCIHWCLPGVPDVWNQLLYAHLVS